MPKREQKKMNLNDDQEQLIRSYLLGSLSEEEQLRVEELFFADNDFYHQILAIEDELKYDYGQGHLSSQERRSFEDRFLRSSESRQRAEMTGLLLNKVSEATATVAGPASEGWLSRMISVAGFRNLGVQYALLALALVMAATSVWLIYKTAHLRDELERAEIERTQGEEKMERLLAEERSRSEQLAHELERERNKPGSPPGNTDKPALLGTIASIALKPGLQRDGGSVKKLQLPPEVEQVRIQLDVRAEGEYESFRASLQTVEGEEIWSRSRLKARTTPSGRFVFLTIDPSVLEPGDYVIVLKGVTADQTIEDAGDYYLTIAKK